MEYSVTSEKQSIDFGASGIAEIMQNIQTIITTTAGTVPLDRSFGIDIIDLDQPIEIAKARLTDRVINSIQEYEPRVQVVEVTYDQNTKEGKLIPRVLFKLKEGVTV